MVSAPAPIVTFVFSVLYKCSYLLNYAYLAGGAATLVQDPTTTNVYCIFKYLACAGWVELALDQPCHSLSTCLFCYKYGYKDLNVGKSNMSNASSEIWGPYRSFRRRGLTGSYM